MDRKVLVTLFLILSLNLHFSAASRGLLQSCSAPLSQYIIAPSYVYPCSIDNGACAWYSFSNGADVVIINPASGPGSAVNSDYANLVASIRAKAQNETYITTILGYVATTYGAKSLAAVQGEIDSYISFYNVDGIFFDEASTDCATVSYYSSLVDYVRQNTASPTDQDFTILNWGTNGPECFLTASDSADVFVTFESPYSSYSSYAPSSYMANYSPSRWYHIIYDVSQSNLLSVMTKSKSDRAGWVFVTNDSGANPYDTAPSPFASYWQAEVDKAAEGC